MEKPTLKTNSKKDNQGFGMENKLTTAKKIEDVQLTAEIIKSYREKGMMIGQQTALAFKDLSNYAMATERRGVKCISNGTEYSSKNTFEFGSAVRDMVYADHLDSYFIDYHMELYRKDVDDKPPYHYMNLNCGLRSGACLKYSKINKRLIVNKDYKKIAVINLEAREVEIEVEKPVGDPIFDFVLFGEQEDRVAAITQQGDILLYKLDYKKKTGSITAHTKFELIGEREEKGFSIAVCEKQEYLLVEISNWRTGMCSRTAIFQILGDSVIQKAVIDEELKTGEKYVIECAGYFGGHIMWIGLSSSFEGVAQVYDYDVEKVELKELMGKRAKLLDINPHRAYRSSNQFFYIGSQGGLVRLTIE